MDFSDILVIELVPLAIDHVLAVGYVMPTCNRENTTLLGFGVQTEVRPGITSAAQTGLAAGRERRERQKKRGIIPVQANFAGAGEPGTATLICLPWKGPLSETEHREGFEPTQW